MTRFFGCIHIATLTACAFFARPALGDTTALLNDLNAAQSAYDHGIEVARTDPEAAQKYFMDAASGFEKVVNGGVTNGHLLYNLGNAQVQSKQIGGGIGSYLQAQRIIPEDSQLQSNLAHARSLVKDRFQSGGGMLMEDVSAWWHFISFNGRLTLAEIAWITCWTIAAFLFYRPAIQTQSLARVLARRTACVCAIIGVILAATVAVDMLAPNFYPQGVTIRDGVMVRKGNGEGFEPQFAEPLSQGVEFRVLEKRPGWLRIRLGDEKTGWIAANQASTA